MRYFLTDFIRLGIVFEPMEILFVSPKKLEIIGDLVYHEKRIHVRVHVCKHGVSKIVSVLGDEEETAMKNFKWLHDFRKSSLRNNVNDIREFVKSRTISFCFWYFCFILHLFTIFCVISSFFYTDKYIFSILFLGIATFSFYKLCRNKWKLIPFASNHYGANYGY